MWVYLGNIEISKGYIGELLPESITLNKDSVCIFPDNAQGVVIDMSVL